MACLLCLWVSEKTNGARKFFWGIQCINSGSLFHYHALVANLIFTGKTFWVSLKALEELEMVFFWCLYSTRTKGLKWHSLRHVEKHVQIGGIWRPFQAFFEEGSKFLGGWRLMMFRSLVLAPHSEGRPSFHQNDWNNPTAGSISYSSVNRIGICIVPF